MTKVQAGSLQSQAASLSAVAQFLPSQTPNPQLPTPDNNQALGAADYFHTYFYSLPSQFQIMMDPAACSFETLKILHSKCSHTVSTSSLCNIVKVEDGL